MSLIPRKLTTILQMDVVRYSAAMEADEERAFRKLLSCRELVEELLPSYEGRIFSSAGDAFLAEFASPTQAVRFALACQESLGQPPAAQGAEERFSFRIGINLGDVMISGRDLIGDEVNVAARIEALAEPGGICISAKVHEEVRGKVPGIDFVSLGTPVLKNIKRPVEVFALRKKTRADQFSTSAVLSLWTEEGPAAAAPKPKSPGPRLSPALKPATRQATPAPAAAPRQPDHPLRSPSPSATTPAASSIPSRRPVVAPPGKSGAVTEKSLPERKPLKPGGGEAHFFPVFAVDCLSRLDQGDEGAIGDLMRFFSPSPPARLVKILNDKLDRLVRTTTDAEKLCRIGLSCNQFQDVLIVARAVLAFRKAIAHGSTAALEHLGRSLLSRSTRKADLEEAVRCLESAASLRSRSAAMQLGEFYGGASVETRDLVRAFLWYWVAAHLSEPLARTRLKTITALMTRTQQSQAASKADAFFRDLMLKKYYKSTG